MDRILSTPASTASKKWPWADRAGGVVVAVVGPVGQRLEGEPGAHGIGAVADEHREEVGVPGVVGQGDQAHVAAAPEGDEAVVGRPDSEDRGDGGPISVDRGVAHDQDLGARRGGRLDLVGQALDPGPEAVGAVGHGEGGVEGHGPERRLARDQLVHGVGVEQERLEAQQAGGILVLGEDGRPRAEQRAQGHDPVLAEGVDRRVGDLGEPLLQVVVERGGAGRPSAAGASRRPWRRWAPCPRRPWAAAPSAAPPAV